MPFDRRGHSVAAEREARRVSSSVERETERCERSALEIDEADGGGLGPCTSTTHRASARALHLATEGPLQRVDGVDAHGEDGAAAPGFAALSEVFVVAAPGEIAGDDGRVAELAVRDGAAHGANGPPRPPLHDWDAARQELEALELRERDRDGLLDEDRSTVTTEELRLLDVDARRAADAREVGVDVGQLLEARHRLCAEEVGEIARTLRVRIVDAGDADAVRAIRERVEEARDTGSCEDGFHTSKMALRGPLAH